MGDPLVFWSIVGGIITTVLTGIVGIYTARSARMANQETSQLTGWKDLVTASRAEIKELRVQMKEDEERHEAQVRLCNYRIDQLTLRFEEAERRERKLIIWARQVVVIMRVQGLEFPPPPPGVEDTDPNGSIPV